MLLCYGINVSLVSPFKKHFACVTSNKLTQLDSWNNRIDLAPGTSSVMNIGH